MKKILYTSLFTFIVAVMCMRIVVIGKAEDTKKENSWRYENGQLTQNETQTFKLQTYARSNAWSKVNGQYVNSNGEIIEGAIEKGIDVSKWEGDIDWEKVKNSDIDFAIIRCGYSINYTGYDDVKWKRNADECTRLGIPFGTYLYSYATTVEEARSEAEHVLRLVKGYDLSYPVYLDMEDATTISVGKEGLAEIAKTFCSIISSAGYNVGVYANKNWWNTYLTDSCYDNWNRWVAQYNSKCTYTGEYGLWQCTSSGTVPGIDRLVDINFGFGKWRVKGISTDAETPQPMEKSIKLNAKMAGDISGLQYKFVWQKDDWKKWGVLKDFDSTMETNWMPGEPGAYTLYLDVKDENGTIKTVTKKYVIKEWGNDGLETDLVSPQVKNTTINLKASIWGNSENLQYKYVWMKDNWKKWGVIKDFSDSTEVQWCPTEAGEYSLYIDMEDPEGIIATKNNVYKIEEKAWEYPDFQLTGNMEAGEKVEIQPEIDWIVSDHKENLQYKYVWMKDDWNEWGVIKQFSPKAEAEWIPEKEGLYYIYVDIKDDEGNSETRSSRVNISVPSWAYTGINASLQSPQLEGTNVKFSPAISGNRYGIRYKYVWMKDNWKEWGVIKDFSSDESAEFRTPQSGIYTIYIDVKGMDGQIKTLTKNYTFVDKTWKYNDVNTKPDLETEWGKGIWIVPNIQKSNDTLLKYKYVWMKDDWNEWGVISDFSDKDTLLWYPEATGEYKIYVDVKDEFGNIETRVTSFFVKEGEWEYQDIAVRQEGDKIIILPRVCGNIYKLQYKYVWMKDDWKEWGVVSDFSDNKECMWKTAIKGKVNIYVDIKGESGKIVTQKQEINIE